MSAVSNVAPTERNEWRAGEEKQQREAFLTMLIINPITRVDVYKEAARFLSSRKIGRSREELLADLQTRQNRIWEESGENSIVNVFEISSITHSLILLARLNFQATDAQPARPDRKCFLILVKTGTRGKDYPVLVSAVDNLFADEKKKISSPLSLLREKLKAFLRQRAESALR
jgi:hypothetical protein